jgi:hypothetical protein
MKRENDEYLCKTYPKMMVNRNKDMQETCMCWGFECGDGWFNILNMLMGNIQHHIDWKNRTEEVVAQVTLDQVKEKFGTLRFYYSGGDDYISGLVSMAESMSGVTCESCGNPAGVQNNGGWMRAICDPCETKREEEYVKRTAEYEALRQERERARVMKAEGHEE